MMVIEKIRIGSRLSREAVDGFSLRAKGYTESISEVAIKILDGAEAGAMRTLHVRDQGLSDFMNMVAGMTQK